MCRLWRAHGAFVAGALVVALAGGRRSSQAFAFLQAGVVGRPAGTSGLGGVSTDKVSLVRTTRSSSSSRQHLLRASVAEPTGNRPSRFPGGFGRGFTRSGELQSPINTPAGQADQQEHDGSRTAVAQAPLVRTSANEARGVNGGGNVPLQERLQAAPSFLREKAVDLRDDLQDRAYDIRESLSSATSSFNSDYLAPLTHLARNPSTIHYSAAISARLSYCMAQQSVVSSTVGGKLTVDPIALSRAMLAALAGGREEPILEALRIPEDRITSTENYAWWSRNLKGIVALMKREAVSIENGEYLLPYDMRLTEALGLLRYNPAKMMVAFAAYYRDELQRKKKVKVSVEEPVAPTFVAPGRYPDYFLESEDFLSAKSSRTMDYDMESKMWGMGDAMRRRSISRIGRVLADKDPETTCLLDVGCGTGRFLTFVKSNFKSLKVTALDLSLFNLQMAKQKLGGLDGVTFEESNAEHMAVPNESQDLVTCNFVLSTVPSEARANVINEIARSLKPGGKVIVVDAAQPEFDGAGVCTLDGLPSWGEMTPIYRAYLKSDLEYGLIKAGLFVQEKEINWVSKVLVAQKPPRLTAPSTHGRLMGVGS